MGHHHKRTPVNRMPCSLRYQDYDEENLCELSEQVCFKAFQYWAIYNRANSNGTSVMEHLRCPMLWCRRIFSDEASTIQHLSHCDQREDAWYWCPQCSRPECFTGRENMGVKGRSHVVGRKRLIRRRAVDFFRNLGRKSCTRGGHWRSTQRSEIGIQDVSNDSGYLHDQKHELVGNSVLFAAPVELPGDRVGLHEMARHTQMYSEMSDRLSRSVQHGMAGSPSQSPLKISVQSLEVENYDDAADGCTVQGAGLLVQEKDQINHDNHPCIQKICGDSELSILSQRAPNVAGFPSVPTMRGTPYSTHYTDSALTYALSKTALPAQPSIQRSPTSDPPSNQKSLVNQTPLSHSSPQTLTALITSLGGVEKRKDPFLVPEADPNRATSSFLDLDGDSNAVTLASGHHQSTHEHVELLRDFYTTVKCAWQQRLASISSLSSFYSKLTECDTFELGITSLKRFYKKMSGYTFDQVFALMHVAWAASYILYGGDRSYCWDKLYEDMLPWHYLISDESEKLVLIRVIKQLSSSRGHLPNSLEGGNPSGTTCLDSPMQLLRNGRILQDCSTFLAGFYYAVILERDEQVLPQLDAPDAYNVTELVERIIQPLLEQTGIEAFRDCISDAQAQIGCGILCRIYEVDAMLIATGSTRSQNYDIYQRYKSAVTACCDEAMRLVDPTWRYSLFAHMLDTVTATSRETDKSQKLGPHADNWPNADVLKEIERSRMISDYPPSLGSIQTGEAISSASSGASCPFSMQSAQTDACETTPTSPTTISMGSSIMSSSPMSPNPTEALSCDLCGWIFYGKYRASNLLRHKRFAKIHNKNTKFKCQESGCGKLIGRSDNMKKHFETFHPRSEYHKMRKQRAKKLEKRASC